MESSDQFSIFRIARAGRQAGESEKLFLSMIENKITLCAIKKIVEIISTLNGESH
jgi:hypothetical protein